MEKSKGLLVIGGALGLLLLAKSSSSSGNDKATLYGVVYDPDNDIPVVGALVKLGDGMSVITNSEGEYRFSSVTPGTYLFSCSGNNYQTYTAEVNLVAGNNQLDVPMDSTSGGGGSEAMFEYASNIAWTEPGSHSGMANVPITVQIRNIGGTAGTVHPTGTVKTYKENDGDPYPRFLNIDMGTHEIAPGQTLTFTASISEYPDEHIILVTIQSEAGLISSEFDNPAKLISFSMPSMLLSEEEYWAQVVLQLPDKANRCYFVDMYLSGNYGEGFSTITSPAIKAQLMPNGTREDLVSYYLHGAGDYTVKGIWESNGSRQIQYPATATYEVTLEGSGARIQKALPAGTYKLILKVTWYEFYTPNVFGQSGLLFSQQLGTVVVQENPGLPTGVYNMNGPASANYGAQVNVSATIRNGSPASKTFRVSWSTDVDFVPRQENTVTMPANSEALSSYSFSMPPIMWTWQPRVRVWCRLYEGETLKMVQEIAIATTPQPVGVFICPNCGQMFNYPPPVNNEELYHQHMETH